MPLKKVSSYASAWWKNRILPHFWKGLNFAFLLGLVISIGTCISSNRDNACLRRQNSELKERMSQTQSIMVCRFDKLEDQIRLTKGEMLTEERSADLIAASDEKTKNTLLALKKFDEGDYGAAYKYAEKGNLDDPDLLFMLGWMYYEGNGVAQSLEKAFKCWNISANAGNVKAKFDLAVMYGQGEYVKQDLQKAAEWLTKAAEDEFPPAAFHLGLVYEKGRGVKRSGRKALEWYERAFELGHSHAGYHISEMYRTGRYIERNREKARVWLLKAAESGDAYAAECVVTYVPITVNTMNDIDEMSMLYKMAKQGSFQALCKIINAYEYGIEVERDIEKAYRWCVEGAENGNELLQIRAGDMCLDGTIKGLGFSDAFRWYKMASEGSCVFPDVYYKLGCLYMHGKGVAKDEKRAVELFVLADAANDGLEEAQVALGDAYREGKGVDRNMVEALNWYVKAADADNENALLRLGNIYEKGDGVVANRRLAAKYYKRAREAAIDDKVEEEAEKGLSRVTMEAKECHK